jgi:hypothetical protein
MADDVNTIAERLRQKRESDAASASAAPASDRSSPLLRAAGFVKGERVYDTASGLDVTVVDASRPTGQAAVTITVKRIDGSIVPRHPDELIKRPTPASGAR